MGLLQHLFEQNKAWAEQMVAADPDVFERLENQQGPEYLWIGCSDSRVPANQVCGLAPGEVFVHRNIANLVVHSDPNCLSVLEYAVAVLQVKHIIVCGHYGCGGVKAAMECHRLGLIDNWLRHVRDVHHKYEGVLAAADPQEKYDLLCELNVIEQVKNVCHTTIVQAAWDRGQPLAVHGWIYRLSDGLLCHLNACVSSASEISSLYRVQGDQSLA